MVGDVEVVVGAGSVEVTFGRYEQRAASFRMTVGEAEELRQQLNAVLPEPLAPDFRRGDGMVVASVNATGGLMFNGLARLPSSDVGRFVYWVSAHRKAGNLDPREGS